MITFPAFKYSVAGQDFYLGVLNAKDFSGNYEIDAHGMDNPSGYQRIPKLIRSKRFANFLAKYNGYFHQTVLMNVRDAGSIQFKPESGSYGLLTIKDKPFIVDGQHRVAGIKALLEGDDGTKFEKLPVPILIIVGAAREEEAFHFFLVNHTQEGVRAELADTLLAKVIDDKRLTEDFQKDVLGSREKIPLTQQAVELAEELNNNAMSVWKGKIAFTQAKLDHTTAISQRGFTQSLKELLRDKVTQSMFGEENLADVLADPVIDYWAAIKELCPKATGETFKEYVLMKTTGAYIMHKLFPHVAFKCGDSMHQKRMRQVLGHIEDMNDSTWASDSGKIGKAGGGYKFYDHWVKKFIKEISKVED